MQTPLSSSVTPKTHVIPQKKNSHQISSLSFDDIDAVVALSQLYFPRSSESTVDQLRKSMMDLFFDNGALLPNVSPIVSRSANGTVSGFLGVISKTFRYQNKEVVLANCHHLMATEEARNHLIPMRLLQHFIKGPQDVSFSDGSSESTRLLWKRLDGEVVACESIYYKIPLRPLSFVAGFLLKSHQNWMAGSIRTIANGTDTIASKARLPLFHRKDAGIETVPLTSDVMCALMKKLRPYYRLFPQHTPHEIDRLIRILEEETRYGKLQKVVLLDHQKEAFGWFIYYAQKGGICEIIQAVCLPGKETELFRSLTRHAYDAGGVELSGRLMNSQFQTPFTKQSISLPGRMWTLMKSDNVELKHTIQSGKAFITRLEGDLWVL